MHEPQPVIYATRHQAGHECLHLSRVVLDEPPIAVVTPMEAIIHGWWLRSPGYPVGRRFGTAIAS